MLHTALLVTGGLLAWLMLLGLNLQLGLSRRLGWRRPLSHWPHHALFFAVSVSLIWAVWLAWRSGGHWWALSPALALLLSMPTTKPGRAGHWQRAVLVALAYGVGVLAVLGS